VFILTINAQSTINTQGTPGLLPPLVTSSNAGPNTVASQGSWVHGAAVWSDRTFTWTGSLGIWSSFDWMIKTSVTNRAATLTVTPQHDAVVVVLGEKAMPPTLPGESPEPTPSMALMFNFECAGGTKTIRYSGFGQTCPTWVWPTPATPCITGTSTLEQCRAAAEALGTPYFSWAPATSTIRGRCLAETACTQPTSWYKAAHYSGYKIINIQSPPGEWRDCLGGELSRYGIKTFASSPGLPAGVYAQYDLGNGIASPLDYCKGRTVPAGTAVIIPNTAGGKIVAFVARPSRVQRAAWPNIPDAHAAAGCPPSAHGARWCTANLCIAHVHIW